MFYCTSNAKMFMEKGQVYKSADKTTLSQLKVQRRTSTNRFQSNYIRQYMERETSTEQKMHVLTFLDLLGIWIMSYIDIYIYIYDKCSLSF